MSDSCDVCGYKSSEIKGGGAISDKGRLITVQVTEQEDLRRDVIKADSAVVSPFRNHFQCLYPSAVRQKPDALLWSG